MGAADRIGSDAPLAIRGPSQRDQYPLASNAIPYFNSISDGPDARVAGAHLMIDSDTSPFTYLQTCVPCQLAFRADSDGKNNHIAEDFTLAQGYI